MDENQNVRTTLTADTSGYKRGMQEAAQETREMGAAAKEAAAGAARLGDSANQAEPKVRDLGGVMGDVRDLMGGSADAALRLAGAMPLAAGVMATAGVAALGLARYAASVADETGRMAQRVGVSAEEMSRLQYAARVTGASAGALESGLSALSEAIADDSAVLRGLGVDTLDAARAQRPLGEVLGEVADKFAALDDGATKAALGQALFKGGFEDLLPLLDRGRDGIAELTGEAEIFGAVVSDELAQQARALTEDLSRLQQMLPGLAVEIGGPMVQSVRLLAEEFLDARRAGLSFMESLVGIGLSNPLKGAGEQVAALRKELDTLRNGAWFEKSLLANVAGDDLVALREKELDYWKRRQKAEADAMISADNLSVRDKRLAAEATERARAEAQAALDRAKAEREREAAAKKAAGEAERAAEAYAGLVAELGGLSPSFAREWALLAKAFESGRMGARGSAEAVAQLTAAQAALLARQPAMRAAERAQEDARRDAEKAAKDEAAAVEKLLSGLEEKAASAEAEVRDYGKTASAIQQTIVSRLEEDRQILAGQPGMEAKLALLDREIEARKRLAAAAGSKEALDAAKKAGEEASRAQDKAAQDATRFWESVYDDVGQGLTDAIFEGGSDGWQLLKRTIEATVIRAVVQPIVSGAVGGVLQSIGLGPGGGAGGSSAIGSMAGSLAGNSLLGGLGGMGGFLGQASLGFTSASTGSLIAAGNAAMGAGQVGAGLGSYLGAAAPWLLGGYAVLSALGAFKGTDGPHRGGAAFAEVGGASGLANAGNTAGFGLDWGAFRSDRSASVDAAVQALVSGSAADLAARAARLGGDASGLRLTGRFASDPDDARGAFRVADASGNVLFSSSKGYGKDAKKGFEQFAGDSTRATFAALQGLDLDDVVDALLDSLDPATASIEALTAALADADAVATIMANGQRDAMEDVRRAGLSAAAAYFEAGERIRTAAQSGAASVQELAQLSNEHYAHQVQLLRQVEDASRSSSEMFEDSARNVRYSVLDDPGKYAMLDSEASRYMDTLRSLTDPAEIERYAGLLDNTINQAFSLLSPEEQATQAEAFVTRFESADDLVQERLAAVRTQVIDDQRSLANDLKTAITDAFAVATAGLERAGAAIPSEVRLRVDVSGGSTRATVELGDGP